MIRLGIDTSERAGWLHNRGLRIYGGGEQPFELAWPDLTDFPPYGLVRPRSDFDDLLARNAVASGAKLYEQANVDRADHRLPHRSHHGRPDARRTALLARRW